jgi:hypothetical protein
VFFFGKQLCNSVSHNLVGKEKPLFFLNTNGNKDTSERNTCFPDLITINLKTVMSDLLLPTREMREEREERRGGRRGKRRRGEIALVTLFILGVSS